MAVASSPLSFHGVLGPGCPLVPSCVMTFLKRLSVPGRKRGLLLHVNKYKSDPSIQGGESAKVNSYSSIFTCNSRQTARSLFSSY